MNVRRIFSECTDRVQLRPHQADGPQVTVSLKLWQVLLVIALALLAAGFSAGRYAFPAGGGAKYVAIDAGNGWGTVYFSGSAAASEFKSRLGQIDELLLGFSNRADRSAAQASVRAAIPSIEAYYADNNTYAGADAPYLQSTYDQGLEDITIQYADSTTYCLEATAGSETWSKSGPGADIVSGSCL
jgi:hypothetical protein